MTCFVSTDTDWVSIEDALKVFSSVSGSKLNLVKSCGLWVGSWRSRQELPLGVQWSAESIRILGVNLFGDYHQTVKDNWDSVYYRSQRSLAYWKKQRLSYRAKSTVMQSFTLSKAIYLFQVIPPPRQVIESIQQSFWQFLWEGSKPLVKRSACLGPPSQGGLWC